MIITQPQPYFISDTLAEITPANYPNHSLFYVTDVDKFFKVDGYVLKALGGLGFINTITPNSTYRTILDSSGSITAAKVAGTYALAQGDPLAVSGTGTLYPINTIYIAAADFPTLNTIAPKLRIRAQLYTNDVSPTGNFTIGLYPITRPGTSGGAGLCIFTLGTVVPGSNGATFTTPAADGLLNAVSSDFSLPSDGHYVLGIVTTSTIAVSSHIQISACLQMRNN